MLIVDKKRFKMKIYFTFVRNNTHHASLRCTLWWVFDFYMSTIKNRTTAANFYVCFSIYNAIFKDNLLALMNNCPLAQEKEMGFPKNWNLEQFWK